MLNTNRNVTERIGQIHCSTAGARARGLGAGDIGAAVKLKDTHTGDTLCAATRGETSNRVSEAEHSRRAPTQGEGRRGKVAAGSRRCTTGIRRLSSRDPELRRTVISAQGGLHLEVIADRLRRRFSVHLTWSSRVSLSRNDS